MGKTLHSVCMCCKLVSDVCPVAVRSAVFCMICSVFVCLLDIIGDQTVLAYSSIGLVIALYVCIIVSFCFPQFVDVSAFIMLSVLRALFAVFCMCVLNVNLGSKVIPSILGCLCVGIVVLFMCRCSVVLYCAGSGVSSVAVVLSAFSVSWLFCVHVCMSCRYGCMLFCAVFMLRCVLCIVMSSAYMVVRTLGGGVGMSCMYMLNSVGDRTPPWGTPVLMMRCFDCL